MKVAWPAISAPRREQLRRPLMPLLIAVLSLLAACTDGFGRPTQSEPPVVGGTPQGTNLNGVPFLVCNVMSIPGDFGDGGDTLWLFEDGVPADDGSCSRTRHRRYVGVGTDDRVSIMSERLVTIDETGEAPLWPYATPDLNSDGVDEIALANGVRGEGVHLWFLVSDGQRIEPLFFPDGLFFQGQIGRFLQGNLRKSTMGLYCGQLPIPALGTSAPPPKEGFVQWQSSSDDKRIVFAQLWRLRDTSAELSLAGELEYSVSKAPGDYPPGGTPRPLCGSPVHLAEEFE